MKRYQQAERLLRRQVEFSTQVGSHLEEGQVVWRPILVPDGDQLLLPDVAFGAGPVLQGLHLHDWVQPRDCGSWGVLTVYTIVRDEEPVLPG
jgi:hypothetical protein